MLANILQQVRLNALNYCLWWYAVAWRPPAHHIGMHLRILQVLDAEPFSGELVAVMERRSVHSLQILGAIHHGSRCMHLVLAFS